MTGDVTGVRGHDWLGQGGPHWHLQGLAPLQPLVHPWARKVNPSPQQPVPFSAPRDAGPGQRGPLWQGPWGPCGHGSLLLDLVANASHAALALRRPGLPAAGSVGSGAGRPPGSASPHPAGTVDGHALALCLRHSLWRLR